MNWKFWFFGKAVGADTIQYKPVQTPHEPVENTKHLSNLDVKEIRSVVREELSQSQLDYDRFATAIVAALNNVNKQETEQHKNIIARLSEIAKTFALISSFINSIIAIFGIWILTQCCEVWAEEGPAYAIVLSIVNILGIIALTVLQWILFGRIRKELKQSTSISVLVGVITTDTALVMTVISLLSLIL